MGVGRPGRDLAQLGRGLLGRSPGGSFLLCVCVLVLFFFFFLFIFLFYFILLIVVLENINTTPKLML